MTGTHEMMNYLFSRKVLLNMNLIIICFRVE